jgi:hypothetical protein
MIDEFLEPFHTEDEAQMELFQRVVRQPMDFGTMGRVRLGGGSG